MISRYTHRLLVAAAFIFAVAIGIIVTLGIPVGIDFTGGALTEVTYDVRPEKEVLESGLDELSLGEYSLRRTADDSGKEGYILRTQDLSEEERQRILETLESVGEGADVGRFTSIGPVIGEELKDKALWALGAVVLIIVLYVAFVFRKVSKPVNSWVYGGITILALLHDVLVPTAILSIVGVLAGVEADVLFVMALLAILGYSVNDTIIVFDRVREHLGANRREKTKTINAVGAVRTETTYTLTKPFDEIVDGAVRQTIARSVNTSLTTVLALTALYLFGGEVTKMFVLMLIAGIVAGTYSSLFIAPPLLIAIAHWQRKKERK